MSCFALGATAQSPSAKPVIPWTPYTQAPPQTPSIPSGTVPTAPSASQPGLVPPAILFQKPSELTLPPMGVPALPASSVKSPSVGVPAVPVSTARKPVEVTVPELRAPALAQAEPATETLPSEPRRADVFRLDNDAVRNRRIQKELGDKPDPFPKPSPLVPLGTAYTAKTVNYPSVMAKIEPTYVIHRRLYFEEPNAERAGWDMGAIQPILSAYRFTRDCVFLPQNVASGLWKNRWDTSAGKCQPGAPTPYYLYPRGYTVSGMLWQVPLTVGLVFIFP